jgi:hypothetical protein
VTGTGIAEGAACAAGQSRDIAAAGGGVPSRPGRLPRNVVALAIAVVVAIGALIAIVAFLAPLAGAAGGCGGG